MQTPGDMFKSDVHEAYFIEENNKWHDMLDLHNKIVQKSSSQTQVQFCEF